MGFHAIKNSSWEGYTSFFLSLFFLFFVFFAIFASLIMKKLRIFIGLLLALLLSTGCSKPGKKAEETITFVEEAKLKTTPVKNQGNSELCWLYAMLATIESEHIMLGDSVNLSPDFLARRYLEHQACQSYLSRGSRKIDLRGMGSTALRLLDLYGAMPYDSYHARQDVNYRVLCRKLRQLSAVSHDFDDFRHHANDLLDREIDYRARAVFMFGARYTPFEFAHSVCRKLEYEALTSFLHHPFGKPFVLETPDNKMYDSYLNVPIDDLIGYIEKALRSGHAVCWEGDISEKGFSFAKGLARLDNERKPCTQEERQAAFNHLLTTDDHAMALVGIAHDQEGNKYFIAKNSWGSENPYQGFMYLSFNYVRKKTIAVFLSREVLR